MRLRNIAKTMITFDLAGIDFTVDAGDVVDVPDRLMYAVTRMGLPLEAAPAPKPVAPVAKASPKAAKPEVKDADGSSEK